MVPLGIQTTEGGVELIVKVVPGSSKTALVGTLDRMLKVKVAAPPEKGKANAALIDFLAKALGVKKNAITLTHGHANPVKYIRISGLTSQDLTTRLGL
jgi:uncharacterized protein (TIGR00251 family)